MTNLPVKSLSLGYSPDVSLCSKCAKMCDCCESDKESDDRLKFLFAECSSAHSCHVGRSPLMTQAWKMREISCTYFAKHAGEDIENRAEADKTSHFLTEKNYWQKKGPPCLAIGTFISFDTLTSNQMKSLNSNWMSIGASDVENRPLFWPCCWLADHIVSCICDHWL